MSIFAPGFPLGNLRLPRLPIGKLSYQTKPIGFRRIWKSYAFAIFGTLLAVMIHEELVRMLGQEIPPFLIFYPVVMICSVWGGLGSGLLATVCVVAAADYFALPPKYQFAIANPAEWTSLLIFLALNIMISVGGGALRHARRELQSKVEKLSETLQLLDLSSSFVLDPDYHIIRWGNGCRRLYGFSAEQALGSLCYQLLQTRFPEPLDQIRAKLVETHRWEGELGQTAAEGCELIVRTEWQPWFDPQGALSAILIHNTDVTAEKQAEIARANLLAIIDGSHDPIVGYSLDGTITSWNRAAERVYGYTAREIVGQAIRKLLPEDRLQEEQMVVSAIKRGETIDYFESKRLTKNGRVIDVSVTVSPVYDARGALVGLSKIARDITQRKAAEAQLQSLSLQLAQANRELESKVQERTARLEKTLAEMEDFSYSITHHLRAPLRAMRGYISLLLQEQPLSSPSRCQQYLVNISEAAERMDHMVVDALDFSKALREELPLKAVDVEALIRGMIDFYPSFHLPQADIVIQGRIPRVLANPAALAQCFSNLLGNAVKFTREGKLPKVRIWSERRNEVVRIWVVDNGIGIAKDQLDRIWGMFQVVSRSQPGTGTGLALTRKVVDRMGGRTGVESELGAGSRFWVELPPVAE